MTGAPGRTRAELEALIVARAWADDDFRRQLQSDPHTALSAETGINIPESITVEVLEETPEKAYLVIPMNRVAISDEQLDVAGGYCDSESCGI